MDIDLYTHSPDQYDHLQNLRPDYVDAKKALLSLALKHLSNKEGLVIADFCSGTGTNTKMLAEQLNISKAVLIDINPEFIEIAKNSSIRTVIEPVVGDILSVELSPVTDAVISMFAYHHVTNDKKINYLEKVKEALKSGGLLFLGEIYSPNKDTTYKYYEYLLNFIDPKLKTPELEKFLRQTAASDDFEHKVLKQFTSEQLITVGFYLLESLRIFPRFETTPEDADFPSDIGTFVEVWKIT